MTKETLTENTSKNTADERLLNELRHLAYPYEYLEIRYRTFTLPPRMAKQDIETLLVKCSKDINGNGLGLFEYYIGQIERVESGFRAVDAVNQELGVYGDRWRAREALVELAAQIFPEWFGYRYDQSLDW